MYSIFYIAALLVDKLTIFLFRFGHKVVNIGGRIFAIGGKYNEINFLDSIEEYNTSTG